MKEKNNCVQICTSHDCLTLLIWTPCGPSISNSKKKAIGEPKWKDHPFGFAIMSSAAQNAQQLKISGRWIKTQEKKHFRLYHKVNIYRENVPAWEKKTKQAFQIVLLTPCWIKTKSCIKENRHFERQGVNYWSQGVYNHIPGIAHWSLLSVWKIRNSK